MTASTDPLSLGHNIFIQETILSRAAESSEQSLLNRAYSQILIFKFRSINFSNQTFLQVLFPPQSTFFNKYFYRIKFNLKAILFMILLNV